ncbi:membrane protein [Rhizobium albus]|nr:membrane protein [Rhizobium albus]
MVRHWTNRVMDMLIARLGLSLAIGLLVGLERGWRERSEPEGSRTAGIRTFGVVGLLGGVLAALSDAFGSAAIFIAGFLGFALLFGWFKFAEAQHDGSFSVTGTIAALCVFALGGLAVSGDYRAAAAGGAALAAVLASREALHGMVRRLSWVELRSAIVLAVMTVIILPLLPNRTLDPWGGFNPWQIWFFTVLTASISFAGYIATRLLGSARGLLVSGLAGAIVSSTAVTVAFARSATAGEQRRAYAGAAALAAMISICRVILIVAIVAPLVLGSIILPTLAAAIAFGLSGSLMLFRAGAQDTPSEPTNPFELTTLLLFALAFAVVATASAALSSRFGDTGLVATSALSGTFDVDVAVLSASRLVVRNVGMETIGSAVLAALAANAMGRLALAIAAGPRAFWVPLLMTNLTAAAAGTAVWLMA